MESAVPTSEPAPAVVRERWAGFGSRARRGALSADIAATANKAGLRVRAALDSKAYPSGVKVADAVFDAINLKTGRFHGDWNYTLVPAKPSRRRNS